MTEKQKKTSTIAKVAIFTRSLNLLQPLQVCLLGSSFAMRRFGYGSEAVSIFVGLCHNAMELLYLFSALGTFVLLSILQAVGEESKRYITAGISAISVCFTVVVNFCLLRVYAMGEGDENVTKYYWMLVLASFAAGIDDMCICDIGSNGLSNYEVGQAMIGLSISAYHWIAIKVLNYYEMDVDYWLITSQLACLVFLSAVAAILWIAYLIKDKILDNGAGGGGSNSVTNDFFKGFGQVLPLIILCIAGYGFMYVIYPLISPFEMVEFEYQYPIQRLCLLAHAAAGISVWLIDFHGVTKEKTWYAGWHIGLHSVWLLVLLFFGIGFLFIYCMHFPTSSTAQLIVMKPYVVGFLTVMYYFLGRFSLGLTNTSIDANANGHGNILSALNLAIYLIVLNVVKYISEAYIQQFRLTRTKVKNGEVWPTNGMSRIDAALYWLKVGASVGYQNFKELATTDVKGRLGGPGKKPVQYRRVSLITDPSFVLIGGSERIDPSQVSYFSP